MEVLNEMARLPLSTIAYACTTRTYIKNALYSIQNVEIAPVSIAVELLTMVACRE